MRLLIIENTGVIPFNVGKPKQGSTEENGSNSPQFRSNLDNLSKERNIVWEQFNLEMLREY